MAVRIKLIIAAILVSLFLVACGAIASHRQHTDDEHANWLENMRNTEGHYRE